VHDLAYRTVNQEPQASNPLQGINCFQISDPSVTLSHLN